jgi:acetylornithine deacetylase/succinyl-diaminopimelate desuccinylase-like protein
MRALLVLCFFALSSLAQPAPDWTKIQEETLRHYQALIRLDTTDPPGHETRAVEYVKGVLDAEGIPNEVLALEPDRANLVARLKGSGAKRPILIMGHTDTVQVDPAKWTFPPFSATRNGGYVYGRGTMDDKDNLTACLMAMLILKRLSVQLDRDVIFVAEAGEEAATRVGIDFLVKQHWDKIDAEICLAEGGGANRRDGKVRYAGVQTAEKIPYGVTLVSHGPAGHGSRPLRSNAVVHLARAVDRVASWTPPSRLNDTTRYYFERLATVSAGEDAARYNGLGDAAKRAAIEEYFAENEPGHYSMLRTSISPTIIKAGYQVNVIPSEAEATLDVRGLPDEDMDAFVAQIKKVVNDPAVEVKRNDRNVRPKAPPSRLDNEAFHALEAAARSVYNTITLPIMSTGATDMAYLRAKGVQCYGIGPAIDEEDGPKGFGAHSDQERLLESELHKFVKFQYDVVRSLAARK